LPAFIKEFKKALSDGKTNVGVAGIFLTQKVPDYFVYLYGENNNLKKYFNVKNISHETFGQTSLTIFCL
jgi:hypothetical protein